MKKMVFIINPRSGKNQIKLRLLDILNIFTKAGYQMNVYVTQKRGDAMEAAAAYGEAADLIVCSGGDGTLNETINGMMALGRIPDLGYIPAGSTNDFASSLRIPRNMIAAAHSAAEGEAFSVDIGSFCNERNFVYIAAFGAFTGVSYMTSQEKKNVLGHQAYMLEGVKSLASIKSYSMRIVSGDMEIQGDFIFGMVTNTISVGGFKGLVTQDVALNDGEFEVLLIRTPRTPLDLSNIINYMFLREESNEYVHKFRTRKLTFFPKEPVDWVLDGEFGGTHMETPIVNLQNRIRIKI